MDVELTSFIILLSGILCLIHWMIKACIRHYKTLSRTPPKAQMRISGSFDAHPSEKISRHFYKNLTRKFKKSHEIFLKNSWDFLFPMQSLSDLLPKSHWRTGIGDSLSCIRKSSIFMLKRQEQAHCDSFAIPCRRCGLLTISRCEQVPSNANASTLCGELHRNSEKIEPEVHVIAKYDIICVKLE